MSFFKGDFNDAFSLILVLFILLLIIGTSDNH